MSAKLSKLGVSLAIALLLGLSGVQQLATAESGSQSQTSSGWPGAPDIHPGVAQAIQAALQGQGGVMRAPVVEKNLSLVGFLNLGISSDVWAHGNFAYVGGFGAGETVKVVDISDPTNPVLVNQLPTIEGSPQDVKAARINTRFFHGDLLVVGNGGGAPPTFGGIQLWDVTDPLNPVQLSAPRIGPVHNLFLYQKGNRAFVLLAIPWAEVFSPIFTPPGFGDLVIVEVTDPANPIVIADWGAGKDGGFPFGLDAPGFPHPCGGPPCRGGFPNIYNHDVWANQQGTVAYLSYWDLGLILLDISDPANPTFIGRGIEPPPTFGNDDGDLHVAVPAQGGNLVVVADEDFNPLPWGFLRVFDTRDASNPVQVGTFATSNALNNPFNLFSIHNIFVRGSRAYLSWYFEGIRVVDLSQPANPREIAAFLPPAGTGPGLFWGIYVQGDLILASDLLSGLFILKQQP